MGSRMLIAATAAVLLATAGAARPARAADWEADDYQITGEPQALPGSGAGYTSSVNGVTAYGSTEIGGGGYPEQWGRYLRHQPHVQQDWCGAPGCCAQPLCQRFGTGQCFTSTK